MVDQLTQTAHQIMFPKKPCGTNETVNRTLLSVASGDYRDHEWEPQQNSDSDSDVSESCIEEPRGIREQKYIVFESCLDDLLCQCVFCSPKTTASKNSFGDLFVCEIICETSGYSNS